MPLLPSFVPDHTLHHIAVTGASPLNAWQECLGSLHGARPAAAHAPVLVEFTSDALPPRDWEIPLLALLLRHIAAQHRCRIALVGSAAGHGVPLAMLAFSCEAPDRIQLCHSLAHARAWLAQSQ